MNRFNHPPLPADMSEDDAQRFLDEVFERLRSVRRAARDLNWHPNDVQLVIWGEVRQ